MLDEKIREIIRETADEVGKKYSVQLAESDKLHHQNSILIEDVKSDFRAFGEGLQLVNEKIDVIDKRLVSVENTLDEHTFLINFIRQEQQEMKQEQQEMKQEQQEMKDQQQGMQQDIKEIKHDVKRIDKKVDIIDKKVTVHDRKLAVA